MGAGAVVRKTGSKRPGRAISTVLALTLAGGSLVVGPDGTAERAMRMEAGVGRCEWGAVPTPTLAGSARGADQGSEDRSLPSVTG